jgi:hypothetical protein
MIRELKNSFLKEIQKAINRMINGYYVDLCNFIDQMYYINSINFCGSSSNIGTPDSQELCTYDTIPPTTIFPPCSFNGGSAVWITVAETTVIPTTVFPYACSFNGGTAILVTVTGCEFNGGSAIQLS